MNPLLFTDSVVKPKLQKSKSNITISKSGTYQKHSPKGGVSDVTTSGSNKTPTIIAPDESFHIDAKYNLGQLTQIHYYGMKPIPREVFKMIATIIHFHPNLTNITISNGLDVYGIYEISNLLIVSHITEVCLEQLDIPNAHYQLLLTQASNLNHLSLSRCTINDEIVENIMSQLKYPLPASKTLIALNLSCNCITDRGVRFIGKALRSNRCLQYLNLAGNVITDKGATFIFDSLMKFPITDKEEDEKNKSYVQYCAQKVPLMTQFFIESISQIQKKSDSKLGRKIIKKSKKDDDVPSTIVNIAGNVSRTEYQKATAFAENILGEFQHPYEKRNVVRQNGIWYCLGNNTLCYLNMAYNNLMVHSIHKLLCILAYQRHSARTPRGLIRIVIEGNPLPDDCTELRDLNYLLEALLVRQKGHILKKQKSTRPSRHKESF